MKIGGANRDRIAGSAAVPDAIIDNVVVGLVQMNAIFYCDLPPGHHGPPGRYCQRFLILQPRGLEIPVIGSGFDYAQSELGTRCHLYRDRRRRVASAALHQSPD
jgi:hypothetical protein